MWTSWPTLELADARPDRPRCIPGSIGAPPKLLRVDTLGSTSHETIPPQMMSSLDIIQFIATVRGMIAEILFIQGAGEGAYEEDLSLANSLQRELGPDFKVAYPKMPNEANAPYVVWKTKIQKELVTASEPVILVGHSLGGSYLAKMLTETKIDKPLGGIFLLEAPFWGGRGWLYEGYKELELPQDAATKFPDDVKLFLYHARDDEIAPFSHLALYSALLPRAIIREINKGGHQLNDDLSIVAKDIKELQ